MSTIERALEKHRDQHDPSRPEQGRVESRDDAATSPVQQVEAAPLQDQSPRDGGHHDIHIDLDYLQNRGLVTPGSAHSRILEEFRFLKRRILNNAFGSSSKLNNNPNLVLVSSSRQSEGKTFNAVNLALSIALEQDKTVLLIDADVIRPAVCATLGIKMHHKKGLMNYLLSEVPDISQVIYKTNIPKLSIIPSGSSHHLSNEMLNSEKMIALINELAQRYPDRIVIFDSPPMLGVNEAHAMAAHAGQIIIVVQERRTKHSELLSTLSLIPEDKIINLVLNKTIEQGSHGYYGYGYYYGKATT